MMAAVVSASELERLLMASWELQKWTSSLTDDSLAVSALTAYPCLATADCLELVECRTSAELLISEMV